MLKLLRPFLAAALPLCAFAMPGLAAGTIPIALQQSVDANGRPLVGALLYTYVVGTVATPQIAFSDTGLTQALPWPLQADANGRLPMFYLADGSVSVRLTDSSGNVLFYYPSMMVVGPSSGGGGGSAVDPTSLVSSGDVKIKYGTGPLTGYVRANGLTIGNVTCGCTERSNADTQTLFIYLWGADSTLSVSGGRGANGLADFTANKQLTLPDMRGRFIGALDDMGTSSAARLSSLMSSTTLGASFSGSLSVLQTNLPAIPPTGLIASPPHSHTLNDPTHTHGVSGGTVGGTTSVGVSAGGIAVPSNDLAIVINSASTGITLSPATITATFTGNNLGSGTPMLVAPPTILMTVYIKL